MSIMRTTAEAIASAAGWKPPVPVGQPGDATGGRYLFRLEGGLDMELLSPDGRMCILRGKVGDLPADENAANALLAECARRAVARARARGAVLTLEDGALVLFRQLSPEEAASPDEAPRKAGEFLNDLAWWRGRVQAQSAGGDRAGNGGGAGGYDARFAGMSATWLSGR